IGVIWESALIVLVLALLVAMLYAWGGYSLLLWSWTRRPRLAGTSAARPVPTAISVILSAYNEEGVIGRRIDNLVARLPATVDAEIHVGVDGCDDRTAAVAREHAEAHAHVTVHEFAARRGKVAVLKDLVARSSHDVLLFTDANSDFLPGAVEALLTHLADATIGGVCGRLVLTGVSDANHAADQIESDAGSEEGFYWHWETRLKTQESLVDSCLGANGAIFAMRRNLFWSAIPDNTMVDDFVLGMKIREQGSRVIYEPAAVAIEELPDVRHEWRRRVRIGTGDYQSLMFCRRCLGPAYGRFAVMFWSHKVLRWFTPHAAALLVAASIALLAGDSSLGRSLAGFCLVVAAIFNVMAVIGLLLRGSDSRVARIPALFLHFVSMQAALLVGFFRFTSGKLSGHWHRTPRGTS
ncbi:MAG: glycosyltransferase, partial [Verrucomicrobia bacterium]|nr:glycosyltransferase [Verrucomicrobiota bacterium]